MLQNLWGANHLLCHSCSKSVMRGRLQWREKLYAIYDDPDDAVNPEAGIIGTFSYKKRKYGFVTHALSVNQSGQ